MNGNPFNGDVAPGMMKKYLANQGQMGDLLKSEVPGMGVSPAALVADVINVQRADVRKLAQALDVEDPKTGETVDVSRMTEDRAADLLSGIVDGDGLELVLVFNELARKRNLLLKDLLDEAEHEQFMEAKTSIMYSDDPDTFDDDGGD